MSIYSGFATRQQEQQYDLYVEKILTLLQKLVCQLSESFLPPKKFCTSFSRIFTKMRQMQEFKYLKPKMTYSVQPLFNLIQDQVPSRFQIIPENQKIYINTGRLDSLPQRPSFQNQRDLIMQYQAQARRRSQSLRINNRGAIKYLSGTKSKPNVLKLNNQNPQIDRIRRDVTKYLGKQSSKPKTQNYFKTLKKSNNHGSIFVNNTIYT